MKRLKPLLLAFAFSSCFVSPSFAEDVASPAAPEMRLYRLACGEIGVTDLNVFSDTDAYVGQAKDIVASCYLIKHGDKWLLWDTGLPDATPKVADDSAGSPFKLSLKETLTEQLGKIGLKPEDIDYVGISHGHFDHVGGANAFSNAKLIMQKTEYDFMTMQPDKARAAHMESELISSFAGPEKEAQRMLLSGDTDIFGDGKLKAIVLPGHTPGHMALLVNLPETGPIILSGDQWHFHENHESNGVPSFNFDRADTLASSDKLNALIKNHKAKLIIQHEPKDNEALPKLPEYLK